MDKDKRDVRIVWNVEIEITQGQGGVKALAMVIAPKGYSHKRIKDELIEIVSKEGSVRCTGKLISIGTCYVLGDK